MFLSELRRVPLLRAAIPFMVGITLGTWVTFELKPLLIGTTVFLLLLIIFLSRKWDHPQRWIPGTALTLFLFIFGICWQHIRQVDNMPNTIMHGPKAKAMVVEIERMYGTPKRSSSHLARILSERDSAAAKRVHGKILVRLGLDSLREAPEIGDQLLLYARIDPINKIPDPGGFDRRTWARMIGAMGEAYVPAGKWQWVGRAEAGEGFAASLRTNAAHQLHAAGLRGNELALARALLLGERKELDPEQRDRFVQSGTIHVLAVSGLHVGLIFVILSWIAGFLGESKRAMFLRMIFTISGIWAYAWLTGSSPSVVRASIMFSLFSIAGSLARQTMHLNSLAAAAIIILIWDPAHIAQPGFQLSFLAVLGIILFYRPIYGSLIGNNKYVEMLWAIATVSIAAQVATGPLSIHAFGAFPIWFLPANVIVVTMVTVVVNVGVATLVLSPIPIVSAFIAYELSGLLTAVEAISGFFARLPNAYLPIRMDLDQCLLLYAVLLAVALLPVRKPFYRWVPLMLLLVFAIQWMDRAVTNKARTSLAVYDDRNSAAFSVSTTGTLYVNADRSDPWMRSKVKKHANAYGVDQVLWVSDQIPRSTNLISGPNLMITPALSIVRVDITDNGFDSSWYQVDVLIIDGEGFIENEMLQALCSVNAKVVLAGSMAWSTSAYLERELGECGKQVHSIKRNGAFILDVPS